jgi:acetyl/propionyl-CoA carboxylase alpha subunit
MGRSRHRRAEQPSNGCGRQHGHRPPNPVEAEDDGTVKEIKCEEGQSVSEGDTLVVLE